MDLDFVSVHKKERGQYPAILTSLVVNNVDISVDLLRIQRLFYQWLKHLICYNGVVFIE